MDSLINEQVGQGGTLITVHAEASKVHSSPNSGQSLVSANSESKFQFETKRCVHYHLLKCLKATVYPLKHKRILINDGSFCLK